MHMIDRYCVSIFDATYESFYLNLAYCRYDSSKFTLGVDLLERVGFKVYFLTSVTYFFYFSRTSVSILEGMKYARLLKSFIKR